MTKEQIIVGLNKMLDNTIKANECGLSNNDFKDDIELLKTVLSMLKEKDTEIEEYKKMIATGIINTTKDELVQEKNKEIEKKDKIIDLMSEWLYEDDTSFGYGKLKDINTSEKIKQYFERKATNNG